MLRFQKICWICLVGFFFISNVFAQNSNNWIQDVESSKKKNSDRLYPWSQVLDSTLNPILYQHVCIPFNPGNGMYDYLPPDYLKKSLADSIIISVFLENGIELEKDQYLSFDSAKFLTSAYNEKSKIGFVWLDAGAVEYTANVSMPPYKLDEKDLLPKDLVLFETYFNDLFPQPKRFKALNDFIAEMPMNDYYNLVSCWKNYLAWKNFNRPDLNFDLLDEIQAYLTSDPFQRDEVYEKELLKRYDEQFISNDEMKYVLSLTEHYIALYSGRNPQFTYSKILTKQYENGALKNTFKGRSRIKSEAIRNLKMEVQKYVDWWRRSEKMRK